MCLLLPVLLTLDIVNPSISYSREGVEQFHCSFNPKYLLNACKMEYHIAINSCVFKDDLLLGTCSWHARGDTSYIHSVCSIFFILMLCVNTED